MEVLIVNSISSKAAMAVLFRQGPHHIEHLDQTRGQREACILIGVSWLITSNILTSLIVQQWTVLTPKYTLFRL